jgi:hypothetical protein
MIRSRFNWIVYLYGVFIIFMLGISIVLLTENPVTLKNNTGNYLSKPVGACLLLAMTLVLFYTLAKFLCVITINNSIIKITGLFKRKTIQVTAIKSIGFFVKRDLYWPFGLTSICLRIILNNEEKITIPDPFYSNIHRVKQALYDHFREKIIEPVAQQAVRPIQTYVITEPEKFDGNPHTSFKGILLYIFLAIFIYGAFIIPVLKPAYLLFLVFIPMIYFGFGTQLYYFLITDQEFIIKNHVLFWIKKTCPINDIAITNFESQRNRSDGLRITTKDFRSSLYSAGSLRITTWSNLKEKIQRLGIAFIE